jgi:hypothetical protein
MEVTQSQSVDMVSIRIDGMIHLRLIIPYQVQSYIDERDENRPYKIDIHLKSGAIMTCEYDLKEKWEQILKLL